MLGQIGHDAIDNSKNVHIKIYYSTSSIWSYYFNTVIVLKKSCVLPYHAVGII